MSWLLLAFAVVGFTFAMVAYRIALRGDEASTKKTAADVWLGIGNAFFAGAGVAVVVFGLQQWVRTRLDEAAAQTELLNRVTLATNLTGYDPQPRRRLSWDGHTCSPPDGQTSKEAKQLRAMAGWSFTAKDLEGARMNGLNLSGSAFDDARLVGTRFICANLDDANFERAELLHADLSGATLRGADLRGADLDASIFDVADWTGALVDISTCWPRVGPWQAGSIVAWMRRRGLVPRVNGRHLPAYGHFCDAHTAHAAISTDGVRQQSDIPPALGDTDAYEERRWRTGMLGALRTLVRSSATRSPQRSGASRSRPSARSAPARAPRARGRP